MHRLLALMIMLVASPAVAGDDAEINALLDGLHRAAHEGDADAYFGSYTADAIFLGTDATERWTMDEFRAYAAPAFADGHGWTYTMTERYVTLTPDGTAAWFHERLWSENYGPSRGTGTLVRTADGWKIAQYNLTFPIPNDLADEMTTAIKAFGSQD